jgi:protein ATS1
MCTIYAIGSNGSGQLGIGHKQDVSVPKQVLFNIKSPEVDIHVRAGGNHTLLISDSAHEDARFHPVRLAAEDLPLTKAPIVLCAATWEASIVVHKDKDGLATRVSSFGIGNKGELGQGELLFRSSKAQIIKDFPPKGLEVVDLAASVSHIVAVLSNGSVYGWGNGRKGQLGEPAEVVYTPREITGLTFSVNRAICGREFTYLMGKSQVVLGSDKWNVISGAPSSVPRWADMGASWGSIFVLQDNGKLLSWGRDDHGQLAPPGLPLLSKIAIGSEHVLGLTIDGNVLAWGWGEHGNCGPGTENGDVKGKWNVIASSQYLPPGSKISSIGAGCATSWICISE